MERKNFFLRLVYLSMIHTRNKPLTKAIHQLQWKKKKRKERKETYQYIAAILVSWALKLWLCKIKLSKSEFRIHALTLPEWEFMSNNFNSPKWAITLFPSVQSPRYIQVSWVSRCWFVCPIPDFHSCIENCSITQIKDMLISFMWGAMRPLLFRTFHFDIYLLDSGLSYKGTKMGCV